MMTLEEETIRAAKTLTVWNRSERKIVSVEIDEYDRLFEGLNPVQVCVEAGEIKLICLNRLEAIKFLTAKYELHDVNTLR